MKRDYGIDLLKAILILLVIVIHVCASLDTDNLSVVAQYLYSMASYAVPVFFIISGYYFYKSSNKDKNIYNLIISYLILSVIYLILAAIFFGSSLGDDFKEVFTLDKSAAGYLWFVKYLIYFHFIMYLFVGKNKILKVIIVILFTINFILLSNELIVTSKYRYYNLIPYFTGIWLAKNEELISFGKLSKYWVGIIFLLPVTLLGEYAPGTLMLYIVGPIVFIIFKNLQLKSNLLSIISKNTLYILAFHGLLILAIREVNNLESIPFIIIYIFVFTLSLCLVYIYRFFEKHFIYRLYIK